jgi:hypothetical protein
MRFYTPLVLGGPMDARQCKLGLFVGDRAGDVAGRSKRRENCCWLRPRAKYRIKRAESSQMFHRDQNDDANPTVAETVICDET